MTEELLQEAEALLRAMEAGGGALATPLHGAAALPLPGGAAGGADRADAEIVRRINPLTTGLRPAVPSPLQGAFGPQAAFSAALQTAWAGADPTAGGPVLSGDAAGNPSGGSSGFDRVSSAADGAQQVQSAVRSTVQSTAADAEALDRIFQRDARRYDGGFRVY